MAKKLNNYFKYHFGDLSAMASLNYLFCLFYQSKILTSNRLSQNWLA